MIFENINELCFVLRFEKIGESCWGKLGKSVISRCKYCKWTITFQCCHQTSGLNCCDQSFEVAIVDGSLNNISWLAYKEKKTNIQQTTLSDHRNELSTAATSSKNTATKVRNMGNCIVDAEVFLPRCGHSIAYIGKPNLSKFEKTTHCLTLSEIIHKASLENKKLHNSKTLTARERVRYLPFLSTWSFFVCHRLEKHQLHNKNNSICIFTHMFDI